MLNADLHDRGTAELRQKADKARRLADNIDQPDVAVRLRSYAEELEKKAATEESMPPRLS